MRRRSSENSKPQQLIIGQKKKKKKIIDLRITRLPRELSKISLLQLSVKLNKVESPSYPSMSQCALSIVYTK